MKTEDTEIIQTTIWDIVELGADFYPKNSGEKLIKELSKELGRDDLIILHFFFRDKLWLIANKFCYIACVSMIPVLEDRLRHELYSIYPPKWIQENNPETQSLDRLRINLKSRSRITEKTDNCIKYINRLRKIFIHTNMLEGFEEVKKDKTVICAEALLGGGDSLKHETTRMGIVGSADKYCILLLKLCLQVLKEIDLKLIESIGPEFDKLIKNQLELKKVGFFDEQKNTI